ncbi:hypothetical protein [Enterobacter cloacae complex sp. P15RS]|uniref:hypothetical protein n=1 Tax=Enterobacter cloacae complex TaxID=354276 RepID=UPI001FD7D12B|nr:hypothetical protein [Enterobacter genomosp. S]
MKTAPPFIKQVSARGIGKIGLAIANGNAIVALPINGEHFLADNIMNEHPLSAK